MSIRRGVTMYRGSGSSSIMLHCHVFTVAHKKTKAGSRESHFTFCVCIAAAIGKGGGVGGGVCSADCNLQAYR